MEPLCYPQDGPEPAPYDATLALEGGGVRGIVTLRLAAEIEKRTGKCATDIFTRFSGASIGFFNCLALNYPNEFNRPKYSAQAAIGLFENAMPQIFYRTFWRSVFSVNGLLYSKYPADGLEKMAQQYLGNTPLNLSIRQILAPAVNLGPEKAYTFDSRKTSSVLMWQAARAGTAAECYFPAYTLEINGVTRTFCDGGTYDNSGLGVDYPELFKAASTTKKIFVVALGTGETKQKIPTKWSGSAGILSWAPEILPVIFDTYESQDHQNFKRMLPDNFKPGARHAFALLEPRIPLSESALDDASPENLKKLVESTNAYIEKHDEQIRDLCKALGEA